MKKTLLALLLTAVGAVAQTNSTISTNWVEPLVIGLGPDDEMSVMATNAVATYYATNQATYFFAPNGEVGGITEKLLITRVIKYEVLTIKWRGEKSITNAPTQVSETQQRFGMGGIWRQMQ